MKQYRVQYDFTKNQPRWDQAKIDRFGKDNEGFTETADGIDELKSIIRGVYQINPYYVKITEE